MHIITETQRRDIASEYRSAATHDRRAAVALRKQGKEEQAQVAAARAELFTRRAAWALARAAQGGD